MKVKKIISTLLALSLVFGSFSALNIASAATKDDSVVLYQTGFDGETTLKEDGWNLTHSTVTTKAESGDEAYGNVLQFAHPADATSDSWPEMYHSITTDEVSEVTDGVLTLEYDFSLQSYGTPVSQRTFVHTGFSDVGFRKWNDETKQNDTKRYCVAGLDRDDSGNGGTKNPYLGGMRFLLGKFILGKNQYFTDSAWKKVKAVYNLEAERVTFYLDGAEISTWKNDGSVTEPEFLKGVFFNGVAAPGAKLWYDNLKVTYDPTPYDDVYTCVEDFEDGYNTDLVATSANVTAEVVTDSLTGSSVVKFSGASNADNWIYIYADKAIPGEPLSEDRTGKAIVEFDYMAPRNYNTGVYPGGFEAENLAGYIKGNHAISPDNKSYYLPGSKFDWYNVKYEFDYTEKTYDMYINGQLMSQDNAFSADALSNVTLKTWVGSAEQPLECYIDNFKAAYISNVPTMAEAISVAGKTSENGAVAIENVAWKALDEDDVIVTLADGYQDAKVTKTITETEANKVKTIEVSVNSWPFNESYTFTCTKSEPNNDWYIEDFEDTVNETIFIPVAVDEANHGTVEDVKLGENTVRHFITAGTDESKNYNLIQHIVAKNVLSLPETKTGKLTYEFDVLMKQNKSINLRVASYLGMALNGAYFSQGNDWYTVKVVFDYATGKADVYKAGKLHKGDIDFVNVTEANKKYFDPADGIQLRGWVSGGTEYWLDNVKISYVETTPEMVESVSVAGVTSTGTTMVVANEVYYGLSADDVVVTLNEDYNDAKVTKTVTEADDKKTITVSVEKYPYNKVYTIDCTPENPNVIGIIEDFEGVIDTAMVGKEVTLVSDPVLGEENKVMYIGGKGYTKSLDVMKSISAKALAAKVSDATKGIVTYQFDIMVPSTNYSEGTFGVRQGSHAGKDLVMIRPDTTWGNGYKGNVGATRDGWRTIKIVMDCGANTYRIYSDNKEIISTGLTYTYTSGKDADGNSLNPIDGFTLKAWLEFPTDGTTSIDFEGYIDNIMITYEEKEVQTTVSDFTAAKTETGITASANFVLGNDVTEEGNPYVIIAVYENDRLIGTELVDADEDEDGVATFDLTYNMDATKTYTAKAMLWNMTTLLPLVSAQTLTVE